MENGMRLEEVRILIVEDEIDDARFALDAIEDEATSVEVEVTPYAERALELVDDRPFDGILLDYRLPRMSGTEFVEEIRARGFDVPIVVLTGRGSDDVEDAMMDAGADAYLDKDNRDDARVRETLAGVLV